MGETKAEQYSNQIPMTFQLFDIVAVRNCANADDAARAVCAVPY